MEVINMYDLVVLLTFIALVLFFVYVEVYRLKHYRRGIIVEIYPPSLGIENMIATSMKVQLQNGMKVDAEAMRCTMCMGNLTIGDQVYLAKKNNKYIVTLPFHLKKKARDNYTCVSNS